MIKIALALAMPPESHRAPDVPLPIVISRSMLIGVAYHWNANTDPSSLCAFLDGYWSTCPYSWSDRTLKWMPPPIRDFFSKRTTFRVAIKWSEAQAQARRPDYASLYGLGVIPDP